MLLFFVACIVGQFIQTVTGFGFGILVMALAGILLPITPIAATVGLIGPLSNLYFMIRYRKKLNARLIVWPAMGALAASAIAIYTIQFLPLVFLNGLLGIVLVGLSLYFMLFQKKIHIAATPRNGLLAGTCAGVLSGYFSTGGPPLVLYMLSAQNDKETYLVTVQTLYFIMSVGNTVSRLFSGYLTGQVLQMAGIGLVGVGLGLFLGTKVVDRLNIDLLRKLAYLLVGISGLWMILNTWVL